MGTGLLSIALDFLAPTLIACTGHPAPFLHRKRGLHLLGVGRSMIARGEVLREAMRRGSGEVCVILEIEC
jgi:hypothetical protein